MSGPIERDPELLGRKLAAAGDAQLRLWALDSRRPIKAAVAAEQRRRLTVGAEP